MEQHAIFDAINSKGAQQLVKLLGDGVDLTQRDTFGDTPLHRAVRQGMPQLVTLLLEHGADVNAKGEAGRTALHVAVREGEGDCDIVRVLLNHSPDLEIADNSGETPLMAASAYRECANLLLENGAYYDLNSAVRLGDLDRIQELLHKDGLRTAPSPAILLVTAINAPRHRNQIVGELLQHGANINEPRSYPPVQVALQDAFNTQDASVLRQILGHHPDTQHMPEPLRKMATRLMQERQDHPNDWLQKYNQIIHVLDEFRITE